MYGGGLVSADYPPLILSPLTLDMPFYACLKAGIGTILLKESFPSRQGCKLCMAHWPQTDLCMPYSPRLWVAPHEVETKGGPSTHCPEGV